MSDDPFEDIRDKRMNELNAEQLDRAHELWLRDNALSFGRYYAENRDALFPSVFRVIDRLRAPIDMVLHCPSCGFQHIDAPEANPVVCQKGDCTEPCGEWCGPKGEGPYKWINPPHRSHLCASCGFVWRPADVPTNGVAAVKTQGKNDSVMREL